MKGVTHYEGIFSHIVFNDLKQEVGIGEYTNFFKRHIQHGRKVGPILKSIIETIQTNFDMVCIDFFVNYYKDGTEYAPYHSDQYGCDTVTVSFGCDRDFYMKPNRGGETIKYVLKHGDIFTFTEDINKTYKHSIPKRMKVKDDRISILFFLKPATQVRCTGLFS